MIEIRTKVLGPTNTKGRRVVAATQWRDDNIRAVLHWDYDMDAAGNDMAAIKACLEKLKARAIPGCDWHSSRFIVIGLECGGSIATNGTEATFDY